MGHHLKPKEPLYETVAVLSYEVGQLLESAMYLYWGKDSPDIKSRKLLEGQAKSGLMDIGVQFHLICESMGVDPEEMTILGLKKAEERFLRLEYKHFDLREERNGT